MRIPGIDSNAARSPAFSRWRGGALAASALIALMAGAAAANKSGVAPNVINVPKGPGSIEGLGQGFQPQLNTGSAPYSLPLILPPGTAGLAPELSLSYTSGNGNGPLGYGWSCGAPFVERRTNRGVPRYVDGPNGQDDDFDGVIDNPEEVDVFVDQSGEWLVPLPNGDYFCRFEGSFIRYRRVFDHWEGTMPNGTRLIFGQSAQARVHDESGARVARWYVEKMIDVHGNTVRYAYRTFSGPENRNQKYLRRIEYGAGAPPWNNFHFAAFEYETRPDWFEDCRFGFCIRTGMRLARIVVGTRGPGSPQQITGDFNGDGNPGDSLVRIYQLAYEGHAHWSLLSSVTVVGSDGVSSLPPARFGYTTVDPPDIAYGGGQFIGAVNAPIQVMDNPMVELNDMMGNGLPDILRTDGDGGPHSVYVNEGVVELPDGQRAIRWRGPEEVTSVDGLAWNIDLANESTVARLADMDGDGISDLVYSTPLGEAFYFRNLGQGAWGPRIRMGGPGEAPPSPFARQDTQQADISGNRHIDIIQSIETGGGADYRVWFNLGDNRFSRPVTVPQEQGIPFTLEGVHLIDFNGDRVADICRIRPLSVEILPGKGYGNFGPKIVVPIEDGPIHHEQLPRAALRDITGNGLPDLVIERTAPGVVAYWVNLGNYTFDRRREVRGAPAAIGENPAVRWADMNGNGTVDLVYADREISPRIQILDIGELIGASPGPNQLTRIENGIGRVIEISYEPTTTYAVADMRAGSPWPDIMPIVSEVVSAVVTRDGLGNSYRSEFVYHDPYYDLERKTFRGFARVEQIDLGSEDAPTQVTRYIYNTGRDELAMKGKVEIVSMEDENGGLFEQTVNLYEIKLLGTGVDGNEVRFAHQIRSLRTVYERGSGTPRTIEIGYDHDQYGNVTETREWGIVQDGNRRAFDDERIKTTQFAVNVDQWILRNAMREVITGADRVPVSRTESFYDDPSFSGNNLGAVSKGNLTMRKEWRNPADPSDYVVSQRNIFDEFGNVVAILDPHAQAPGGVLNAAAGHCREIEYDPLFRAYPVRETIHTGAGPALEYRATYNPGFNTTLTTTNFNGHEARYGHDVFGRNVHVIAPGDSAEFPTQIYRYFLAVPLPGGRVVNFTETKSLDRAAGAPGLDRRGRYHISRGFVDGMGRDLMTKIESDPDPETGRPRVAVSEAAAFNARQSPKFVLQPYYTEMPGDTLDELLAFEDIHAEGWTGAFHEDGVLRSFTLEEAQKNTQRYDALMRTIEAVAPDGAVSRTVYEPLRRIAYDQNDTNPESPHFNTPTISVEDGLGRVRSVIETARLDDAGRRTTDINAWTTAYDYDVNDQIVRITDAQGNVRIREYDGLQRLVFMNDPNRGQQFFVYDDANNLIESRDAKGQRIQYAYDGVNRVISENHLDSGQPFSAERDPDVRYRYDVPEGPVDLGNGSFATPENTLGQLVSVTDWSGAAHTSYDARERISWTTKQVVDPPTGRLRAFTRWTRLDSRDRMTELTYPDGDRIAQRFNARMDLDSITGAALDGVEQGAPIVAATRYAPDGRVTAIEKGNGLVTHYGYDRRGRVNQIDVRPRAGSAVPLLANRYQYDGITNPLLIEDVRPGAAVPEGDPRRNTQRFEYDDHYRLVRASYSREIPEGPGRPAGSISYRYDRIGNMLSQVSDILDIRHGESVTNLGRMAYGGEAGRANRVGRDGAAPGPHALTSTEAGAVFAYDANGNVTRIRDLELVWDFKDRLVAIESETMRAEYRYDYTDRRVVKQVWERPSADVPFPELPRDYALYVNEHFEVRAPGQTVKYVMHDRNRVARITGAIDPEAERTQWLSVLPGWNLLALAVDTEDAAVQLGTGTDPAIAGAFLWNREAGAYTMLAETDQIPARAPFWLYMDAPAVLQVRGRFIAGGAQSLPAGGGFIAAPGLEPVALTEVVPDSAVEYQFYDAAAQTWRVRRTGALSGLSNGAMPAQLYPGQAVYVVVPDAVEVPAPAAAASIQYYHQDHLGSTSLMTDAGGGLLYETAYYPFGYVRNEFEAAAAAGTLPNHYEFLGKERDRESDFSYFEARYLAGHLGRFLSVDPIIVEHPAEMMLEPQMLHAYAYARNNPLSYRDPDGEAPTESDRMKDDWDKWDKLPRPRWLGWLPSTDFKGAFESMQQDKKFSFKGVLFGLQEEKKDPGLLVPFNKHHKKLGLEPQTIEIKRWGKTMSVREGVVTESDLADAINDAANKRIHDFLNKVRTKAGAKPMDDYETVKEKMKLQGTVKRELARTSDKDERKALQDTLKAIKQADLSAVRAAGEAAQKRREKTDDSRKVYELELPGGYGGSSD